MKKHTWMGPSGTLVSLLALSFAGCGTDPASEDSSGGSDAGGAATASGGAATSSGGSANGSGGASKGAGGALSGAGGANPGVGGNTSTGGSASGGAEANSGGSAAGGNATGGADDGAGGGASEPTESAGCGTANPTPCDTSGSPCTMDVGGTERNYYVVLPDDYDETRAYPVVFQYHPLGGNAEQGMNMYNVRPNFPDAIYITPDGLTSGQYQGWSNTGGEDEAFTRAIVAEVEDQYCIDRSRYFSTGFSFGGSMSYTAALCMSDIFRAIGAMAGAPISGAGDCTPERPVAAWINHGTEDTALPITMSEPLRDELVAKNGCSETTQAVDPSPCVAYDDCDEGYPVVWCEVVGAGHEIPGYSPTAIADFFKQF